MVRCKDIPMTIYRPSFENLIELTEEPTGVAMDPLLLQERSGPNL